MTTQEQAEQLREEAHAIIQNIFKVPAGVENTALNRLVDCIISAAVLQVASLQEQARNEQK